MDRYLKVELGVDEKWPVFCLTNTNVKSDKDFIVYVPEMLYIKYKRIQKEYDEIQIELRSLYASCESETFRKTCSS
jgi:hypothetical protein